MASHRCLAVAAAAAVSLALVLQGCAGGGGGSGGDSKADLGTCGATEPSSKAGCQNVDFGSCGNACCNLILAADEGPDDVVAAVKATIANGGPDGKYDFSATADGVDGFDNLTKYSSDMPPPFKDSRRVFIGQVHHTTAGEKHFVDSVNINMRSGPNGGTIIHAFSLSLIGGAFGDNGQNFKNIQMILEGLKYNATHLDGSCPATAKLSSESALVQTSRRLSDKLEEKVAPAVSAAPVVGTCGSTKPSPVEDCKNVDFGSCGNACCSLLIGVAHDPLGAMQRINDTLFTSGGPDGYYTLQMTAEGTLGFANLSADISHFPAPYNTSTHGVYLGQAHHMTDGKKHYNDTINFNVYKNGDGVGAFIHATSVSLIGGALGDNGQNYKNIIMAIQASFGDYYSIKQHFFDSCPDPTKIIV